MINEAKEQIRPYLEPVEKIALANQEKVLNAMQQ